VPQTEMVRPGRRGCALTFKGEGMLGLERQEPGEDELEEFVVGTERSAGRRLCGGLFV